MSRLRVNAFEIALDGYGAGPGQSLDNPMGFADIDAASLGYVCTEHVSTEHATHVVLTK